MSVLFGYFEIVSDIRNTTDKLSFFSAFCQVLNTSKYLRVMEVRDTLFEVKGRPVGSCRWSNPWLVVAQHGIEPALTPFFMRSVH